MWATTTVSRRFGTNYPLVQGPFGGGLSTPELTEPFALGRPAAGSAIFAHYRALLGLRASHAALRRGEVQFVPAGAERVVRYWRAAGNERLCVTINLAGEWRRPAAHPAPAGL